MLDPVESVSWLWRGYAVALNTTLFLAGMLVLARMMRGADALTRARVWSAAVVGTGVVMIACMPWYSSGREVVPISVDASVLSGALAMPMVKLAAAGTAARYAQAAASPESLSGQPVLPLAAVLCALWLAGTAIVLLRLLYGWIAVARLARSSELIRDPEWLMLAEDARRRLHISRRIVLRRAAQPGTPLTWGTLRPTLLLPRGCDAWPSSHRRGVLLHEMAHVRQNDCLIQIVGQLIAAALWFHPLIWVALHRLHEVREEACDARVLAAGVARSDYAECLLRICDLARLQGAAASVAVTAGLIRGTRLRRRLHRILLNDSVPRRRGQLILAATASALLVIAAGSARLSPAGSVVRASFEADDWATRALAALQYAHNAQPAETAALELLLASDPDPRVRHAVELLANRPH